MKARNGWLLALAVALMIGSALIGGRREGAEFAGSDGRALETVAAIQPGYRPWFGVIWEPPPEIAGGLFALQAALGAGALGYCLGYKRGRARRDRADAGD